MSAPSDLPNMPHARWVAIAQRREDFTTEEIADGWHYCHEWDGLPVGPTPDMRNEWACCTCVVPLAQEPADEHR